MLQDATGGLTRHRRQAVGSDVGERIGLVRLNRDQLSGPAARRASVARDIDRLAFMKRCQKGRQPRSEFAAIAIARPRVHPPTLCSRPELITV
jgi:hypothetical protein